MISAREEKIVVVFFGLVAHKIQQRDFNILYVQCTLAVEFELFLHERWRKRERIPYSRNNRN